jgi:23S rRNA pseudouridine955/2504/2580 synthase
LTQILHEDDAFLVINKPAGMAVHGGTGLHYGLIETLRNARGEAFLELAHRLDRDTSGCLILAKSMRALRWLHAGLREGTIGKHYLLLARGIWKRGTRTVRSPLTRKTRSGGEAVVRVDPQGKTAITQFSLRQQFRGGCLLTADLGTGRTHQIRVHAAHLGHPIAGDDKYGDADFNRLMRQMGLRHLFLHAARIEIPRESAVPLVVEAPLPADLQSLLQTLATDGGSACHNPPPSRRQPRQT